MSVPQRIWLIVAVALDIPAVAGLVMVAIGGYFRANGIGLIYYGASLGLFALPGAVVSSIAFVKIAHSRGVRNRIVVPVVAVLSVASLVIGPVAIGIGWSLTPNPAIDHVAALQRELEADGAVEICSNGDPGFGPDNTIPWTDHWNHVPASDPAGESLGADLAASGAGRALALSPLPVDPERPDLLTLTSPANSADDFTVTVEITAKSTPLYCSGVKGYGDLYRAAAGEVVVRVSSSRNS